LEQLQEGGDIHIPEISMNGFSLNLSRDKRLPDKEPVNKPHLLTGLMPSPEQVSIGEIIARNGTLKYAETGERTGRTGHIRLDDMQFNFLPQGREGADNQKLEGTFKIYGQGLTSFAYGESDTSNFWLQVSLKEMPLPLFNQMVDSLEAVKVRSGYLKEFEFYITGDSATAMGEALISYEDLHLEIFKRDEPEARNLGSELLTLLADGIVLRHSRTDAVASVQQSRITYKSPINYWIKSVVQGVMKTVRKGKEPR